MMEILLCIVVGTLCIVCFLIGTKVGQQTARGETVELPTVNPIKAVREREERKAAEEERNKIETILDNIDRYDGTGLGQKDVPR